MLRTGPTPPILQSPLKLVLTLADVMFLEDVTVAGAKAQRRATRVSLRKSLQDGRAEGIGIKVADVGHKMACHHLALYGKYHSSDLRAEMAWGHGKDIRDMENIVLSSTKRSGAGSGSVFDVSVRPMNFALEVLRNIRLVGYENILNEGGEREEQVLGSRRRSRRLKSKRLNSRPSDQVLERARREDRVWVQHFALQLPGGCLLETMSATGRSIMCTAPRFHMESESEARYAYQLKYTQVRILTPDHVKVIQKLVLEAIRINNAYRLRVTTSPSSRMLNLYRRLTTDADILESLVEVQWITQDEYRNMTNSGLQRSATFFRLKAATRQDSPYVIGLIRRINRTIDSAVKMVEMDEITGLYKELTDPIDRVVYSCEKLVEVYVEMKKTIETVNMQEEITKIVDNDIVKRASTQLEDSQTMGM